MCGVFGFALKNDMPMERVFDVLKKLEVHQYPNEPRPLGGYGAGIAALNSREIMSWKVGAVNNHPTGRLGQIVPLKKASVVIAHVRMPSPEFMETARYDLSAQPYTTRCFSGLALASVHNGKVENYREIREELGPAHRFESEKVGLIDSEVIPHYLEDRLKDTSDARVAVESLFNRIQGSSCISLLHVSDEGVYLHFIHKGKTRGLVIWRNNEDELIFCSRTEGLSDEFREIIENEHFRQALLIRWSEDVSFKQSFCLKDGLSGL